MPLLRVFAGNLSFGDLLRPLFSPEPCLVPAGYAQSAGPKGSFDILNVVKAELDFEFQTLDLESSSVEELAEILSTQYLISRIVNIGPEHRLSPHAIDQALEHLQVLESIEIDPLLSWFWDPSRRISA